MNVTIEKKNIDENPRLELFTELEAAKFLRISIASMQRIRYRQEIAYHKIGGRILYSRAHLENYLASTEQIRVVEGGVR